MRVTIQLARPWKFVPGQHAYIYMPSVSLFSSHPFSVAWCGPPDETVIQEGAGNSTNGEKAPAVTTKASGSHTDHGQSTICFVTRVREGFTRSLLKRVQNQTEAGSKYITTCFLEGPYGNTYNTMDSYGRVVLFAGGVGITHQLPYARYLSSEKNTGITEKVLLVWAVNSPSHAAWVTDWLNDILSQAGAKDILRVHIYISKPEFEGQGGQMMLPGLNSNDAVKIFAGKTSPAQVLDDELLEHRRGSMAVSVCGPGGLSDDVRLAVRERQHLGSIDYIEASFSW